MWIFNYYSFKLAHKSYTLFLLKPLFSNLTFVYFLEVVNHHLHLLPQHHWSHLHLACMFTSHLCYLPHILPQFPFSDIMFLLIQIPMMLKCIPCITWLEFFENPKQFLIRLSSIDKYLISVTEPFPYLYWIKLTLKLLKQLLHVAWSLPLVSRACRWWLLVLLPPSMTFHPHHQVMQPFLISSDTNFFYHPSTYSNSLEALVSYQTASLT